MSDIASMHESSAVSSKTIDDLDGWRSYILSRLLLAIMLLGLIVAIPSILALVAAKTWPMVVLDVVAEAALVVLWYTKSITVRRKASILAALVYLFGTATLFSIGVISQIYLMAFPVVTALFIGVRATIFAVVLNALTLMTVGLAGNPDLRVPGLEDQPLLNWVAITANFTYVSSLITIASILMLRGLEQSLDRRRDNEARLRLALNAASQAWFDVHLPDGKVTVSPEYPRMIGFDPETFESSLDTWLANVHPDDKTILLTEFNACIADGGPHALEYRRRKQSGDWVWIRSVAKITAWDANGHATRMIGVHTDITERKRAETSLKDSEHRYRAVFEHAGDGLLLLFGDKIVDCNSAILHIFKCDRNYIVGKSPETFSPPLQPDGKTSLEKVGEKLQAVQPQVSQHFEWLHKRPDGSEFLALVTMNQIVIGGLPHLLAAVRDISEQRRFEEERRIAAIAFDSQEGIFVTDAQTRIIRVNHAFTRITGYTAQETIGKTPSMLSSGIQDEQFYATLWNALIKNGVWQGELWNRRKNGETYPEWLTISAVTDEAGKVSNYVATLTDITTRKASEKEIEHLAFYDPLTQLPNRRLLLDRLQQGLASSARSGHAGGLLFIDLDNFKMLNDTLGHDVGDLLLQQVAQRILGCVREGDTVARIGGDEFVVMLEDLGENIKEAANRTELIGEKILMALNQPYSLAGHEYHNTPSIGATLYAEQKSNIDELLKQADLAMYQAKAAGRNTLRFFDPEMQTAVTTRVLLETEMRAGLHLQEFLLYYQPQVDPAGRMVGAEALVRWQHPRRGLISPAEFIPVAEETGQIIALGNWVIETACRQLAIWATRPETTHLTLAVNISARQFHDPEFVNYLLAIIQRTGVDPHRLELELTESILLKDIEHVSTKMLALRQLGVRFSLDDFGTGYSSLAYLKRLPLDQLKIDQSFVRDILTDANDAAIAQTIVALAQSLSLRVIAEGVETRQQLALLSSLGCNLYQGYLFGRPQPVAALEQRDAATA